MARNKSRVVPHRPELLGNGPDQLLLIAALEIPTSDGPPEEDVPDERKI
jgi:hypothetical protein